MSQFRNPPCPCRSEQPDPPLYSACCQPWHDRLAEGRHAATPEELMRSRYSAYVLGLVDYLLATWYPATAPGHLELSPAKWLGLEVRRAEIAGDAGVVEFVARCRALGGKAQRLHEISRFLREHGRWYYIDGQTPADGAARP